MKVNISKLIILSSLIGFIPNQSKADIYSFDQTTSSSIYSPSVWTFQLDLNTLYNFSTWYSDTDTTLFIYQKGEDGYKARNDDASRNSIYSLSQGLSLDLPHQVVLGVEQIQISVPLLQIILSAQDYKNIIYY